MIGGVAVPPAVAAVLALGPVAVRYVALAVVALVAVGLLVVVLGYGDPGPSGDDGDDEVELFTPPRGLYVELPDGTKLDADARAAVAAAGEYLESNPTADVAEVREALYEDHPAGHDDPEAWWSETVHPGVDALFEVDPPVVGETPSPEAGAAGAGSGGPGPGEAGASETPGAGPVDPGATGTLGTGSAGTGSEGPRTATGSDADGAAFTHEVHARRSGGLLVEVTDGEESARFLVDDRGGSTSVDLVDSPGEHAVLWIVRAERYLRDRSFETDRDRGRA